MIELKKSGEQYDDLFTAGGVQLKLQPGPRNLELEACRKPMVLPAGKKLLELEAGKKPLELPAGNKPLELPPYYVQADGLAVLYYETVKKLAAELGSSMVFDKHVGTLRDKKVISLSSAIDKVYSEQFGGKLRMPTIEEFSQEIYKIFEQKEIPEERQFVHTNIGLLPMDRDIVRTTIKGKENAQKKASIEQLSKEISRKEKLKLSTMIREYELELYEKIHPESIPKNKTDEDGELINYAFKDRRNQISHRKYTKKLGSEFNAYMETYSSRFLEESDTGSSHKASAHRLRMIAGFLWEKNISLGSVSDFEELKRHAGSYTKTSSDQLAAGREIIFQHRRFMKNLAIPKRVSNLTVQELEERIEEFNERYTYRFAGISDLPYCDAVFALVYKMIWEGQSKVSAINEYLSYLKNPDSVIEQKIGRSEEDMHHAKQRTFLDMYIHFNTGMKIKRTPKVAFNDAVIRTLSYHPHRYEQEILWQIFFWYNHLHRRSYRKANQIVDFSDFKTEQQKEKALEHYIKYTKNLAVHRHDEKVLKNRETLKSISLSPKNFFDKSLVNYGGDYCSFIAGRIGNWGG